MMIDLRVCIIAIAITGAPVISGALAQSAGEDITSLVKSVSTERKTVVPDSLKKRGTPLDTLAAGEADGIFDVLSFVSSSDTESEKIIPLSAGNMNILDNIIAGKNGKIKKGVSSEMVLDFMANAYNSHGFYQTGHWDDSEDYSALIKDISLPPYVPDDFHRPVWGRVTSGYGYRPSFRRVHKGIDLALDIGDTVRAALPGVVAKVGYDAGGYGHFVVMVHSNGMETRYAHLQRPVSSPGETLSAGEPVGLGGNTGNSTGPHLHFEIRYRGTALDPASVFNFNRKH